MTRNPKLGNNWRVCLTVSLILAVSLSGWMAPAQGADMMLYVSNANGGAVIDTLTLPGEVAGTLIPANPLLGTERAIELGLDGNLLVASLSNNSIEKFDITAGIWSTFATVGGANFKPVDMAFDAAGSMYVSSFTSDDETHPGTIEKFDGTTGAWISTIVTGLGYPRGLAYSASSGNLLLADGAIKEYSTAGALLNASWGTPSAANPRGMTIGPNGNLYAAVIGTAGPDGTVEEFNIATGGAPITTYSDPALYIALDVTFDDAGYLYVTDIIPDSVQRFNVATGVHDDAFSFPTGTNPDGIVFAAAIPTPEPQPVQTGGMYVSNTAGAGLINRFNPPNTADDPLTGFTGAGNDREVILGLDGNLLVSSLGRNAVMKLDYGTGTWSTFAEMPGDDFKPVGQVIASDGNLYVSSFGDSSGSDGSIEKFDATTGAHLGTIVSGLGYPRGLTFDDGWLYLAEGNGVDAITRYDLDGNLDGSWIADTGVNPRGITVGPNGNLYTAVINTGGADGAVEQYDISDGSLVSTWTSPDLYVALDVEFGDDGYAYVTDVAGDYVLRFDAVTGAYDDTWSFPVTNPDSLLFVVPEPSLIAMLLIVGLMGLLIRIRRS